MLKNHIPRRWGEHCKTQMFLRYFQEEVLVWQLFTFLGFVFCFFGSSINSHTFPFHEEPQERKADHLSGPSGGVGRVGLFVYSKSPLDLQILASHVPSLTLIFIVHSFRESFLDSFRSHQPHRGLPCRFEETGSPFWVTHPLEWSAVGKVVLFCGLHCRCDKGEVTVVRLGKGRLWPINTGDWASKRCRACMCWLRKEKQPVGKYR